MNQPGSPRHLLYCEPYAFVVIMTSRMFAICRTVVANKAIEPRRRLLLLIFNEPSITTFGERKYLPQFWGLVLDLYTPKTEFGE